MLKAGGPAERLAIANQLEDFDVLAESVFKPGPLTLLGYGSNVLVSDLGLKGLTVINRTKQISHLGNGIWEADCGAWLQDLVLASAQKGYGGLEFAVGIPGSVGGALVSNAGAYRSSIGDHLVQVQILDHRGKRWVEPSYLKLSYRNSRLRENPSDKLLLLSIQVKLHMGSAAQIYGRMREYQRQRISKQPPPASAGSFFKNVHDQQLANQLENLPDGMRKNGVIPAGFLIEACGLKGFRLGRAMVAWKHANFIVNDQGASATEIRQLAQHVKNEVFQKFQVSLQEEVLYLGDWPSFPDSSLQS